MRLLISLLIICATTFADTPSPTNIKARMYSGDGITPITSTSGSINVNLTNSTAIVASDAASGPIGSPTPTKATLVAGSDGTNLIPLKTSSGGVLEVNGSGSTQPVSAASLPLPSGAATSVLQSTGNSSLASIDSKLTSPLSVSQSGAWSTGRTWTLNSLTDSISTAISSIALPTGASTEAKQDVGNSSLASIDSKLTSPLAVTGTFYQATQPVSAASLPLPSGASTSALQGTANTYLSAINGKLTSPIAVSQSGTWTSGRTWNLDSSTDSVATTITSIPLPFGASTAANQSTEISKLTSIDSKLSAPLSVTGTFYQATQPVSAATLPLPAGASTSAKQDIGNASLASIDTKLTAPLSVTGAFYPATQPISATSLPLPTGAATSVKQDTEIATLSSIDSKVATSTLQSSGNTLLTNINAKLNSLGQKAMVSSMPVAISSDQSAIPVTQSGSWTIPLPSGAATSAKQDTGNASLASIDSKLTAPLSVAQSGTWNLNNISGTVSLPTGAATGAKQDTGNSSLSSIDSKLTNGTQESRITDGTNTAAVKGAATAPTVSDPSLVVAISPNSPIEVTSVPPVNTYVTGSITTDCASGFGCGVGSYVQVATDGYSTLGYETHGTWSATITTDISYDPLCESSPDTVLWFNTASFDTDGNRSQYITNWGSGLDDDPWVMNVASAHCARVRAVSFTSGPVEVSLSTGVGTSAVWSVSTGNAASGATDYGNPVKVGGRYNTSFPTLSDGQRGDLQLDSSGRLYTASTQSGTWNINNVSGTISLPTGAATSANQTTANASLSSIDSKLTSPLSVAQSGTWNINNVSGTISLPTGAATSANQTTANSSLSSIDGKLNSLGQKAMTASVPVVISSDQSAVPASQSGTWNINNVSGTVSLPTGASTEASLAKLTLTQGSTTSGQSGPLMQAAVTSATPSYTTSQTNPLSLDTNGNLRVTNRSAGTAGSAVPDRVLQVGGSDGTNLRALATDTSGNIRNVGNVASGATDSGDPIKIGGKYNSSTPSFTNGQRGDLQIDQFGNTRVSSGGSSFANVTTATTTTHKSGAGRLLSVCLGTNAGNGHTLTLYDNTAGSGTTITTITTSGGSVPGNCMKPDLYFSTGLTSVTTGTSNWTLVWQ